MGTKRLNLKRQEKNKVSPRVLPAYCLEKISQAQGTVRGAQAEGLTLTVQRSRKQLLGSAEGLPWLGLQGSSDQYVSAWKFPNATKRATRRDQQGAFPEIT